MLRPSVTSGHSVSFRPWRRPKAPTSASAHSATATMSSISAAPPKDGEGLDGHPSDRVFYLVVGALPSRPKMMCSCSSLGTPWHPAHTPTTSHLARHTLKSHKHARLLTHVMPVTSHRIFACLAWAPAVRILGPWLCARTIPRSCIDVEF